MFLKLIYIFIVINILIMPLFKCMIISQCGDNEVNESPCVCAVESFVHSQSKAWKKEEGCGNLMTDIKLSLFTMNGNLSPFSQNK